MAKATLLQRQLEMSEGRLGVHSGRRRSENFITYLESLGKTRDSENTRAYREIASKRFASFAGEQGRPERLPLGAQAIAILDEQSKTQRSERITVRQVENAVFPLPRQSTIDKELKKWGEDAEITKPMSMHKARHAFAVLSLSSGIDIYTTSKLLGHKNLATTQTYARVVDEKKREAVGMLPTID